LKETEATLRGTVNPGGEASEYFFEYGTSTEYGQLTAKTTLSAGGADQAASAVVKNLTSGTEYHFRLVAENKQGREVGADHAFTTSSPSSKEPPAKEPPTKEEPSKEPPAKEPSPTAAPTPPRGPISPEPEIAPLVPALVESSLKLGSGSHATSVRGSIEVSKSGAGGRLQIELLAKPAALGLHGSKPVVVGRVTHASIAAGKASFAVTLNARAKRALRRHHKLALTVRITLTPPGGRAVRITHTVVLSAGGARHSRRRS
jgi:hypothetical protein